MKRRAQPGFTLIELLSALIILSLLALMSYRGLSAVLDARDRVSGEADKWRHVAAFFTRFESDVELIAPRAVRDGSATAPPWRGQVSAVSGPFLEFSRFASGGGIDVPRRVAYRLNARGDIELWVWPGLDMAPGVQPARYPVLSGVRSFELEYLDPRLSWVESWPPAAATEAFPRAVRVRIVLASGEQIVRVFALAS